MIIILFGFMRLINLLLLVTVQREFQNLLSKHSKPNPYVQAIKEWKEHMNQYIGPETAETVLGLTRKLQPLTLSPVKRFFFFNCLFFTSLFGFLFWASEWHCWKTKLCLTFWCHSCMVCDKHCYFYTISIYWQRMGRSTASATSVSWRPLTVHRPISAAPLRRKIFS